MGHAVVVGVGQTLGGLDDEIEHRVPGNKALLFQQFRQVDARDVLHHEVEARAVFPGVVGGDDVGMVELGRRFHFSVETLHRRFGLCGGLGEDLDGHDPLHQAVLGLENLPHAPFGHFFKDLVVPDHQQVAFAGEGDIGLEFGQFSGAVEGFGQFFGRFELLRAPALTADRPDVLFIQQLLFDQILGQLIDRNAHEGLPAVGLIILTLAAGPFLPTLHFRHEGGVRGSKARSIIRASPWPGAFYAKSPAGVTPGP